ncbi:MAG: hypothetical protein QMD76_01465 [Anaerosomatales bacterium]|jgi:protein-S-isoprenylcysteine O-methyltransferase Ste14|uniref:hypothetical protein n=1 Tax=Parvivirga hydrogeniphila TaxID=2939460 RepID=UPI001986082C|nr:hypothetical protein [Parvivirga hydrogeniphila]MBC7265390.1 hypothetical protein [Coriobacteriia bacterium]MCL4078105.1 hypothetical protein [Parvivirga hydrogeniphila]MDI6691969.1 hypothetical protein [Anaerosomatales bacterium]
MTWVYLFWALALLALVGIIADVVAIRRKERKGAAIASLVMKGAVVLAYVGWAVFFGFIRRASGWEDLATFAGILVLSVPVLLVALILDAVLAFRLSNQRG